MVLVDGAPDQIDLTNAEAARRGITGARWGLTGAEAVLKLRTLRTNGDFDA